MSSSKRVLFYCVNCVDTSALRMECREQGLGDVTVVSLPCSGKVTIQYLIKAVENGAAGVALMTCPPDACRFLEGSARAERRARAVDGLLEEAGPGAGHVGVVQVGGDRGVKAAVEALARFFREVVPEAGRAA
jgi:coenzyme F420-reducing hydrogenase delta subunit